MYNTMNKDNRQAKHVLTGVSIFNCTVKKNGKDLQKLFRNLIFIFPHILISLESL